MAARHPENPENPGTLCTRRGAHRRVDVVGQAGHDDGRILGPPGAQGVGHHALDGRQAVLARPRAAGHIEHQAEALQAARHRCCNPCIGIYI